MCSHACTYMYIRDLRNVHIDERMCIFTCANTFNFYIYTQTHTLLHLREYPANAHTHIPKEGKLKKSQVPEYDPVLKKVYTCTCIRIHIRVTYTYAYACCHMPAHAHTHMHCTHTHTHTHPRTHMHCTHTHAH